MYTNMQLTKLYQGKIFISSLVVLASVLFLTPEAKAQEGSPDMYNLPEEVEEDVTEDVGYLMDGEDSYYYQDTYISDESSYYEEEEVTEDTSSVSMLTFNFLFYIVYKLKFEDSSDKQETSKTADD